MLPLFLSAVVNAWLGGLRDVLLQRLFLSRMCRIRINWKKLSNISPIGGFSPQGRSYAQIYPGRMSPVWGAKARRWKTLQSKIDSGSKTSKRCMLF